MLRIHFLNVGHGDSIVVEYVRSGRTVFGVIDSNADRHTTPSAVRKLDELNADSLSFVVVTHPHADHYKGIHDILKKYRGEIGGFYTFPLGGIINNRERLEKLARQYLHLYENQDDPEITQRSKEFLQILLFAQSEFLDDGNWFEVAGSCERLAPSGFEGLEIYAIQPPLRAKGSYFEKIETGNLDLSESVHDNSLSIALLVKYAGRSVILGGDATSENWRIHRRWQERSGVGIESDVVKLPHHGSKIDCDEKTLNDFFPARDDCVESSENRYAIVSANGISHPSMDVIRALLEKGITPRCTNQIEAWTDISLHSDIATDGIDPSLAKFVRETAESGRRQPVPCKGDISVSITSSGEISVDTQYNHLCGCDPNLAQLVN